MVANVANLLSREAATGNALAPIFMAIFMNANVQRDGLLQKTAPERLRIPMLRRGARILACRVAIRGDMSGSKVQSRPGRDAFHRFHGRLPFSRSRTFTPAAGEINLRQADL